MARITNYPPNEQIVRDYLVCGSMQKIAESYGVRRESLRDYVNRRPELKEALQSARLVYYAPEKVAERNKQSKRRWKNANPEKVRAYNRRWGKNQDPERRRFWNAYNRERRAGHEITAEILAVIPVEGQLCSYCGAVATSLDHVTPIANGGATTEDNLVPACKSCNSSKKDRSILMFLLSRKGGDAND